MNVLPFDHQVAVISALAEGLSIRSTERLTGVHRDTVMRLGLRVGTGCGALHDRVMRDVRSSQLQLDELWAFIGKKQKRLRPGDAPEMGDCYTFIGLDAINKAIISYQSGKRDAATARSFVEDLRARVLGSPIVSSDAFPAYEDVIRNVFGDQVHYGQIVKRYVGEPPINAARRYSPGTVVGVHRERIAGFPPRFLICTSHVERQNLSMRMASRRFTRLTNGFSKKAVNHAAAVSLYVAHYNLCRVHETLRITPAMAIGATDHVWSIAELLERSHTEQPVTAHSRLRRIGRFHVIDGGLKE